MGLFVRSPIHIVVFQYHSTFGPFGILDQIFPFFVRGVDFGRRLESHRGTEGKPICPDPWGHLRTVLRRPKIEFSLPAQFI